MDQDTKDLVRQTAAGTVDGFMQTVGAPLAQGGQWWGDLVLLRRMKTTEKVVQQAIEMCERLGLPLEAIDLKVLVPWLQNVGLEQAPEEAEDPEAAEAMHERWAALLANAALGEAGADVTPAFAQILSELQPAEAAMLEWLAQQRAGGGLEVFKAEAGYDMTRSNEGQEVYDVYVDNLERLQLISVSRPDRGVEDFQKQVAELLNDIPPDVTTRSFVPSQRRRVRTPSRSGPVVQMTALGRAFVAACTPPTDRTPAEEPED